LNQQQQRLTDLLDLLVNKSCYTAAGEKKLTLSTAMALDAIKQTGHDCVFNTNADEIQNIQHNKDRKRIKETQAALRRTQEQRAALLYHEIERKQRKKKSSKKKNKTKKKSSSKST